MEVATLLHKMALADGIPTSQARGRRRRTRHSHQPGSRAALSLLASVHSPADPVPLPASLPCPLSLQLHMPGLSTSASFDDLLHQLIQAEGGLPASL